MLLNTKWVLFGNKRVRYMIHLCWYLTEPKAVPLDYTFIKWPVLYTWYDTWYLMILGSWWYSDGWTDCTFIFLLVPAPSSKQQRQWNRAAGRQSKARAGKEPVSLPNTIVANAQVLQIHKCCKYYCCKYKCCKYTSVANTDTHTENTNTQTNFF